MRSIMHVLFTKSIHCVSVGGSLRNQCLVIPFLLASMRFLSTYLSLIPFHRYVSALTILNA